MRRSAFFAAIALGLCSCSDDPDRNLISPTIVSNNPCIDAILVELVATERIAAISHYSQQAGGTSMDLELARSLPAIGGTAEEIIALKPDIALVGAHTPPGTLTALRSSGIRVETVGVADSIEASLDQIRQIGKAVGSRDRAETLVQRIASAAERNDEVTGERDSVLVWQSGGLVPGEGTLIDDLLARAGFRNAAADYDLAMWDILPLEPVALTPPDIVVSPVGTDNATGMRRDWLEKNGVKHAEMPPHLLYCAGPTIIDAMQLFKQLAMTS